MDLQIYTAGRRYPIYRHLRVIWLSQWQQCVRCILLVFFRYATQHRSAWCLAAAASVIGLGIGRLYGTFATGAFCSDLLDIGVFFDHRGLRLFLLGRYFAFGRRTRAGSFYICAFCIAFIGMVFLLLRSFWCPADFDAYGVLIADWRTYWSCRADPWKYQSAHALRAAPQTDHYITPRRAQRNRVRDHLQRGRGR